MKRFSLQWRITIMTALLLGIICISMKLLLCSSGMHYMDTIGNAISLHTGTGSDPASTSSDSGSSKSDQQIETVIQNAQDDFCMTNWHITAAVTLLGGILAYFLSGHALKPLHNFAAQVEKVQMNNLTDMKIDEDMLPEFRQLSHSFNGMLDRLNSAFETQRQFTGNAAHELRTPLALMQAQLELFSAEHPDVLPETADFLQLLREQTERLSQLSKTMLELSSLRAASRTDSIQLSPMIEEIFTDLAPLAEQYGITLLREGDFSMIGSDTLIYRLIFNLTENAIKYNRPNGRVRISISYQTPFLWIRISDEGHGIPEEYRQSVFHPFFRVDKSRSRDYGGVGLGLSLVWEIAALHDGSVWVETSSEKGTTIAVQFPIQ